MSEQDRQMLIVVKEDISRILVSGHDDCIRVARSIEALDIVLRPNTPPVEEHDDGHN